MTTEILQAAEDLGIDTRYHEDTTDGIKHYTHIVSPPENKEIFAYMVAHGNPDPSAQDIVDIARVMGWRVTALCGYKWIPQRNPDAYDACPVCMDVAGMHMRNAGE